MNVVEKQIQSVPLLVSNRFKEVFYFTIDQRREELKYFFRKLSKIVWNGYLLTPENFNQVPPTKHDILFIDAQFIEGTNISPEAIPSFFINVSGTVKYGISNPTTKDFHHTFILDHDPEKPQNAFFVTSCVIRETDHLK